MQRFTEISTQMTYDLKPTAEALQLQKMTESEQSKSELWEQLGISLKNQGIRHRDWNDAIAILGFWNVSFFAIIHFNEYLDTDFGKHHDAIFEAIPRGERGIKVNILAPRGSAKSTVSAVIYPMSCIYYKVLYERLQMMPDEFILIISKAERIAASRVRAILRKIENHEPFGELKGNATWGLKRAETSNGVMVAPVGRGGQVRGELEESRRPSLIISDDLDDPETVNNPDVRAKDQEWFDTDLIRCGRMDGLSNFLNIDTVKHEESIANIIRKRPGWRTLFFQAIQHPADLWHPTQEMLWKQWETIFSDMTMDDAERIAKSDAFYEANSDVFDNKNEIIELWPEVLTYLDIRKEICDVGYFSVLRELQNSVYDPSRAIFDMDTAIKFSLGQRGLIRSDGRAAEWEDIVGLTVYLDWAGGKKLAENASACVVAIAWEKLPGMRRDNESSIGGMNGYVLYANLMQVRPQLQVAAMFDALQICWGMLAPVQHLRTRFVIEGFVQDVGNAQEEQYRRAFNAEGAKRPGVVGFVLEFYQQSKDKYDRIASLEAESVKRLAMLCGLASAGVRAADAAVPDWRFR